MLVSSRSNCCSLVLFEHSSRGVILIVLLVSLLLFFSPLMLVCLKVWIRLVRFSLLFFGSVELVSRSMLFCKLVSSESTDACGWCCRVGGGRRGNGGGGLVGADALWIVAVQRGGWDCGNWGGRCESTGGSGAGVAGGLQTLLAELESMSKIQIMKLKINI